MSETSSTRNKHNWIKNEKECKIFNASYIKSYINLNKYAGKVMIGLALLSDMKSYPYLEIFEITSIFL